MFKPLSGSNDSAGDADICRIVSCLTSSTAASMMKVFELVAVYIRESPCDGHTPVNVSASPDDAAAADLSNAKTLQIQPYMCMQRCHDVRDVEVVATRISRPRAAPARMTSRRQMYRFLFVFPP